jgi:hypothetical protein
MLYIYIDMDENYTISFVKNGVNCTRSLIFFQFFTRYEINYNPNFEICTLKGKYLKILCHSGRFWITPNVEHTQKRIFDSKHNFIYLLLYKYTFVKFGLETQNLMFWCMV